MNFSDESIPYSIHNCSCEVLPRIARASRRGQRSPELSISRRREAEDLKLMHCGWRGCVHRRTGVQCPVRGFLCARIHSLRFHPHAKMVLTQRLADLFEATYLAAEPILMNRCPSIGPVATDTGQKTHVHSIISARPRLSEMCPIDRPPRSRIKDVRSVSSSYTV